MKEKNMAEKEVANKVWCKELNGAWQYMHVCQAKECFCPAYEKKMEETQKQQKPKRTK
jgi:hypothetical protein